MSNFTLLNKEEKDKIDAMSHYELLSIIRFAPLGDPRMIGEKGTYIIQRREQLRREDPNGAVADSKRLGWL